MPPRSRDGNLYRRCSFNGKNITRANDGSSTVSIPGLASKGGKRFVTADSNGTLSTSNYTINDYETALKKVDDAVSSVGALQQQCQPFRIH